MTKKKKKDGPQFLPKTEKAREKTPPEEKKDFTQLRPPGVQGHPLEEAEQKAAAMQEMSAAAARAEDRLKKEQEGGEEKSDLPNDDTLDAMTDKFLEQFQLKEMLNTQEQRDIIEKRLEDYPIKLGHIYELGEFRQRVPIIPEEFEPEFRSITPEEDIQLKAMMSNEDPNMSIRYLQDKYSVYQLVCGLRALNDREMAEHFTNHGGWDKKAFEEKGKTIMRMPVQAVISLVVHYQWFDDRCKKVFQVSDLKNG
jgi:hypothetical protein